MAAEDPKSLADDGDTQSSDLAERHGISIFKAREIIDQCGDDLDCREKLAYAAKVDLKTD